MHQLIGTGDQTAPVTFLCIADRLRAVPVCCYFRPLFRAGDHLTPLPARLLFTAGDHGNIASDGHLQA
jgi:hypothetical protein